LADSGTHGINLIHIVNPDSYRDFAELVVPELRRRGRIRPRPERPVALRARLQGSARVRDDHPAARHRDVLVSRRERSAVR
jgi:long-chain alkane monooxygenase